MQTQENDLWFGNPTPFLGTFSPGPSISPRLSWSMLVLGHLLQLHRTFLPFAWLLRARDIIRHLYSGQEEHAIRTLRSWLHCGPSWLWKYLMSSGISGLSRTRKSTWEIFGGQRHQATALHMVTFPITFLLTQSGCPWEWLSTTAATTRNQVGCVKKIPFCVLQPEGGLRRPDKWSSLLTPSQLCLLAFSWLCSLS